METDGDRIRRDPEDNSNLGMGEVFPGDEAQQFLIVGPEQAQGPDPRALVLTPKLVRRPIEELESVKEARASVTAASVVGQDASTD